MLKTCLYIFTFWISQAKRIITLKQMKWEYDINIVQSDTKYFYCYYIEESTNSKLITHLQIIT